jgi:glycosyltransferase involved in cell wall biosynthesis
MRIAYLTAGAAGMYCGSCMHDNALARAMLGLGHDCLLLPVYTPIRTDEPSVSDNRVFFGGINVYLLQRFPWLRVLPHPLVRWLDSPRLLNWVTKRAGGTQAETLGDLTVSMLRGVEGNQAGEVRRLVRWLADDFRPDCLILTNLLIAGCLPEVRRALPECKIFAWLQGDDIFLDFLPQPYRDEATELISGLARQTDACLVNSHFYSQAMAERFRLPESHFRHLPLAIQTEDFLELPLRGAETVASQPGSDVHLGYFARLAPEKGFHHLVDAFLLMQQRLAEGAAPATLTEPGVSGMIPRVHLHYAGWLGDQHRQYFQAQQQRLVDAGLESLCHYHGSPDRAGKLAFLSQIDVLSVPTEYADPKGLFLLESMAAGIPVVQPDHGSFPELLASTEGGLLYPQGNVAAHVDSLLKLLGSNELRREMGYRARLRVLESHSIDHQAEQLVHLCQ